jgi:hypothetical protein
VQEWFLVHLVGPVFFFLNFKPFFLKNSNLLYHKGFLMGKINKIMSQKICYILKNKIKRKSRDFYNRLILSKFLDHIMKFQ